MSGELAKALVAAQKNFGPVTKSHENPHYKSKYADLSDVLKAVLPALQEQGILLSQPVEDGDLVTRLTLGDEHVESRVPLILTGKPQELGSQMTYLRRYCLSALLGVASEDDDDGNAASKEPAKRATRKEQPTANSDGEPLADKAQTAQFVQLCQALDISTDDRRGLVDQMFGKTSWRDVTRDEAALVLVHLRGVETGTRTLSYDNAGRPMTFAKDEEPFDVEPANA